MRVDWAGEWDQGLILAAGEMGTGDMLQRRGHMNVEVQGYGDIGGIEYRNTRVQGYRDALVGIDI